MGEWIVLCMMRFGHRELLSGEESDAEEETLTVTSNMPHIVSHIVLNIAHCTLHIAHCTLHIAHCTSYIAHRLTHCTSISPYSRLQNVLVPLCSLYVCTDLHTMPPHMLTLQLITQPPHTPHKSTTMQALHSVCPGHLHASSSYVWRGRPHLILMSNRNQNLSNGTGIHP